MAGSSCVPQNVSFDLDGTLVNTYFTTPVWEYAVREARLVWCF